MTELSKAAMDIVAERQRQIEVKRFTPEHDDGHDMGELAIAAAAYLVLDRPIGVSGGLVALLGRRGWHLRPKNTPRENAVVAGALILAEIERLDRAAPVV